MEPNQVQDPRKQRTLERLQTFQTDPELAKLDEQTRMNEQIEPISKVFELFLGQKDGQFMDELNRKLDAEVGQMKQSITSDFAQLQNSLSAALDQELSEAERQYIHQLRTAIGDVERRFQTLKTQVTPKPGKDFPTYQELFEYIENAVPALREVAVSAINILETMEGDARLDAKAIRNIEENIDVEKLNLDKYDDTEIRQGLERLSNGLSELARTPPRVIERTSGGGLQFVTDASGTSFQGVTKLKFVGGTVSKDGDTVTVTISGGGGGGGTWVNETPAGTVNGSNTSFTLANTPTAGSLFLYVNGQFQRPTDDYTISGDTITMGYAPPTGSTLYAQYQI